MDSRYRDSACLSFSCWGGKCVGVVCCGVDNHFFMLFKSVERKLKTKWFCCFFVVSTFL